jgi:hypothetical protein
VDEKYKIQKYNNMIIPETWVCGKSTKVSFPSDGSRHKDHALCAFDLKENVLPFGIDGFCLLCATSVSRAMLGPTTL